MKKVKILPIYLSFLILIYIISVMTVNLSSFPGLHGDEAWFGINAGEILTTILIEYCPHCLDFPKSWKII